MDSECQAEYKDKYYAKKIKHYVLIVVIDK